MVIKGLAVSKLLSPADVFWWRVCQPQNPMVINILASSTTGVWTPASVKEAIEPQVKDNIRLKSIPVPTKFGGGRPYLLLGLLLGLLLDLLLRGGLGTLTAWGTGIGALYEFLFCGWKWTWVPVKDFNIEDYIKLHVLDQPTEDCLHDFINKEISAQLPKDRGQFKVIILHNVEGGGSKLLFRFHHIVGDGAGIGMWFHQVCNGDAESSGSPLKPKIAKLNPDDATSKSFLTKVHDLVGFVVVELIIAVAGVLKMLLMTRDSNSPFKGPNLGNKKTVLTASRMELKVDEVKAIGKLEGKSITVNDTVCALLAGTFRRYFKSCRLHPEQMTLRVCLPINMRRSLHGPIVLHNQFSLVFKSLPIHLPTPEERLANFHVRMGLMKLGFEPNLGMLLMRALTWLPDRAVDLVVDHFTVCSSAVMTNVNGTQKPYTLGGHVIDQAGFWVPSSGDLGVGISILTYGPSINIGLVADDNLIADWEPFVACMQEEWADMKQQLMREHAHPPTNVPVHPREMLQPSALHGAPDHSR